MPFTFAHPAAVLPLRRVKYLQTVPLIIGSITPDLPYFVPARIGGNLPSVTHSPAGSFLVDIPIGFGVLLFLFLLRQPLTALLGVVMRWRCLRAMEHFREQPLHWLLVPVSLLVGAWTHIAWDSFTHADGWVVRRVSALSVPVTLGWYTGELCHVLQYVSSIVGLAAIALWYTRLPSPPSEACRVATRAPAGVILAIVLAAALLIGGFQAMQYGRDPSIYHMIYLLLTRVIAWFGALYFVAGSVVVLSGGTEPQPQPR